MHFLDCRGLFTEHGNVSDICRERLAWNNASASIVGHLESEIILLRIAFLQSPIGILRLRHGTSHNQSTGRLRCTARFVVHPMHLPGRRADRHQKAAFEDFLTNYKSTTTETDDLAADALQDLNLDEDGLSDEYDFMDDVGNGKESRPGRRLPAPKRKYMDLLQKVVDRKINEVIVELDDLDNVRSAPE